MDRDERSALLAMSTAPERASNSPALEDPTQMLLSALRTFHEAVGNANRQGWSDDAMDHLVAALEIGIDAGWATLIAALTDTGRILKSYEDGGRARESVQFLEKSYQYLCLMATDLLVGQVSPGLHEKWRKHYQEGIMAIHAAGLRVAQDDDGENSNSSRGTTHMNARATKRGGTTPFDDTFRAGEEPAATYSDELPTLDELPPLDDMLAGGVEPGRDALEALNPPRTSVPLRREASGTLGKNADDLMNWMKRESPDAGHAFGNVRFLDGGPEEADAEAAMEAAEELDEVEDMEEPVAFEVAKPSEALAHKPIEPAKPAGIPRIVIDILDRMCDQLNAVQKASGDDRTIALERLEGAISVLKREATKGHHKDASALCEAMGELCVLASITEGPLNERFMDLGYAFGGAYMDAMGGQESRVVSNWRIECDLLIETWDRDAEREARESVAEIVTELDAPSVEDETVEVEAPDSPPHTVLEAVPAQPAFGVFGEGEAEIIDDAVPEMAVIDEEPATSLEPPTTDDLGDEYDGGAMSARLLESAQRAAAQGDGTGAKFFALRAAASIARDETKKAERTLKATEGRLKQSMGSTEKAREQVKQAEDGVMKAATQVAERESELGSAQVQRGRVAQQLEDLQAGVAELEEQIRALQARRELEIKKVEQSTSRLEEAQRSEKDSEARLSDHRQTEAETRSRLESCRQEVKNHQRLTLEIESDVEKARERLTQQKTSLGDIEQTIEQICGNEKRPIEDGASMLF